jgi:hypothetical protein
MAEEVVIDFGTRLTTLTKKINAFIRNLKRRQQRDAGEKKAVKEYSEAYEGNESTVD